MPPRSYASQGRRTRVPSSNRDQKNLPLMRFSSIIYGRQEAKRWDTTDVKYKIRIVAHKVSKKFGDRSQKVRSRDSKRGPRGKGPVVEWARPARRYAARVSEAP